MFLRRGGTELTSSPRFILVTGGARAGKSRFALSLAEHTSCSRRLFIATAVACDPEMKAKIAKHRRDRNSRWKTLEEPADLPSRIPKRFLSKGSFLLMDCLPTFVTNLMLAGSSDRQILLRVRKLLRVFRKPGVSALAVTNEVGLGLVPEHPMGRRFRDLLGTVNQEAARSADEVYLLVAGLPVKVK
ncbi:MAG: bifunctional adenosylcobinamide kinase/adenosylcobinamide-phosphate guanylyltransferase [Candidatus Omnitrophota bacterium]|nr:bifunctional adenosylcobinamide kinase/adenosylcobinamide-phosphate guanylyltransferase [Candidatus Omnitrophota bacterium]